VRETPGLGGTTKIPLSVPESVT